mgnify:CR=1 FL=1
MSYFHERMLTIIGAEAFHGPVRDGKVWFHFAMVIRHDLSPGGEARPIREKLVIVFGRRYGYVGL